MGADLRFISQVLGTDNIAAGSLVQLAKNIMNFRMIVDQAKNRNLHDDQHPVLISGLLEHELTLYKIFCFELSYSRTTIVFST